MEKLPRTGCNQGFTSEHERFIVQNARVMIWQIRGCKRYRISPNITTETGFVLQVKTVA